MSEWLTATAGGLLLRLHIQPGAKTSEVVGEHAGALKIRLAAPPIDGRANAALIEFLAATLALPRAAIDIKSGHNARAKRVFVAGGEPEAVIAALGARQATR